MRLRKLILQGFKSFADRTEFVFDSPITGIVGPNGCGKSNVVDGFKWVLGEQSAKSLRGDAMMDVIFNGSGEAGGRKPAGMAEVVLVFDNPRREDGSRMLSCDADEVAVGRRLFRDGTSEYQVNNQSTRLRDIREMFLDTGVGADAYSVIEQGRVAAMLEANPEQRRIIFEEAAGISKFKAKKKETLRKLEKVDQNLLRVNDIVEEVEKRLRGVKIQAGRARTYQEYSTRLRELRLEHALNEYHTQRREAAQLESKREETQFRLEDVSADLARRQNDLAEQRLTLSAVTEQRQRVEYELVRNRAAQQSAQQRQQYAQRQLQQIEEQRGGFERDLSEAQEKLRQVQSALEQESARLAELTGQVEGRKSTILQRQQAYAEGQHQLNGLNQQVEQHKQTILDLMRKLAHTNSRLGAIEIERKNIAQQQHRLGERRRTVVAQSEALETSRVEMTLKQEAIAATIAQQQLQLEARRADAAALGKQIGRINEQLGAAREHRSGLLSRCKLLEDLEAKREGVSEGVKSVLRQRVERFSFVEGLVADVLRVDVEHAHAIEAALDGRDQLLITHDSVALTASRELLEELEGRVNILCTDRLPEFHNGYDWNKHPQHIRLAADLVRFEPQDAAVAEHLLGRTVVVETLADAMELHRSGPAGYRYVTAGVGEVVESDGTVRAGPLTAAMGLLSRRSELEAVRQQIAEVEGRIEKLTEQLSQDNAQAKQLAEAEGALRTALYQSNTARVECNSQLAQATDKLNALLREQPVLDRELQQWMEQSGRLTGEQSTLADQRSQLEQQQAQHQQQVEQLTESHRSTAEQLKQFGEELTSARIELGQVQEKQLSAGEQVRRHQAAVAESDGQIERIARAAQALDQRQEAVGRELQQAQHDQSQLQDSIQQLEAKSGQLAQQVGQAGQSVSELSADVERIRQSHGGIEQELHAVELHFSQLQVKTEALVGRVAEELELDLPARYVEAGEGDYQPAELDWEAVSAEIKLLREKIQRLGNVNLDAIGEQDELEQRQQFLSAQVADLSQSKKQLEELIDAINTESAQRFEQTFNAVREHFQGMFRKLFGGGKADIYLETELDDPKADAAGDQVGPDGRPVEVARKKIDILDAGIEIIARPPGKQPVSISQLSGGEKTMTCVALLMSIFKSKPSPFCILDEVDAALDEANNQRFNTIVQEFLDQSQFIIITHSKRTMQVADVLYGVTMQEQGVSKRVAVRFDQVDAQGRLSEHVAA